MTYPTSLNNTLSTARAHIDILTDQWLDSCIQKFCRKLLLHKVKNMGHALARRKITMGIQRMGEDPSIINITTFRRSQQVLSALTLYGELTPGGFKYSFTIE